jgi:hypothetical protein
MNDDDQILRRHFIAIATDVYQADGTFAALDVGKEVAAMRRWLVDEALGERRFDDQEYVALAHRPSYDQIMRVLLPGQRRFTNADAVVVYVTGHGITGRNNDHMIVLHDTNPKNPITGQALRTADLIQWLASHQGLDQVMIIIDVCQAGQLDNNLSAELKRDLPRGWLVVVTAPAGMQAKLGAFAGAVESTMDELRGSADATARTEPYLQWQVQFLDPVARRLEESNRQPPMVPVFPWRPSVCLPNPGYDPGRLDRVVTSRARRDLAILAGDMTAHWAIRAPVGADGGPVFTGRARLMQELIAFTQGPAATLVVAGRAGCGKSASLARLVTCSDPAFRAEHTDALSVAKPVPPQDAVDVAILATGKTSEQIAQQLGRALGIDGPQPWAKTALEGWVDGIVGAAEAADRALTVVVDALDEATDPGAVLTTLLARVNSPERQRLRLLVGVRSSGGPDAPGEAARDLASVATVALGARQIRVDDGEFWEPHDLAGYVEQLLQQPGSPYQDRDAAASVAAAVEAKSGRSYLVAGLTARALAEFREPLAAGDPRFDELLARGSAELVDEDLRASVPEADDRRRAVHMLRASALAEGRGVPVRTIWPLLASAIADDISFGDRDVAWLLGHRLSGYLVRDTEDGLTVYRPFHEELRQVLRAGTTLDAGNAGAGLVGEAEAQRRITWSLLPLATWGPA